MKSATAAFSDVEALESGFNEDLHGIVDSRMQTQYRNADVDTCERFLEAKVYSVLCLPESRRFMKVVIDLGVTLWHILSLV